MSPDDRLHRPMPDHNAWPAFALPWDDVSSGPTDMSFLLDKPAGASGFIRIADGHLVRGDGRRWRIWGQNITGAAPLPPMRQAPILARYLAKYGINCVRLHHMDHRWPGGVLMRRLNAPALAEGERDVFKRDPESTRALDPEAMARLDYFIACCRDNGIYIDLNLNVSRPFTAADGVKQADWIGYGKALTYFDPQLIRLQKEYAAQMLGHVNPYTGHRYAEDPAIAIVELVNENSILESWVRNRLRGEQTTPFGTWGDIPPAYAADLDRLWNDWLAARYPNRQTLLRAWENDLRDYEDAARGSVRRLRPEDFAAASKGRFHDEATFYAELEQSFFRDMDSYLRGELGVRQVIIGTSDHNHGIHGTLHVQNNAVLGIIDGHVYWQHPRYMAGDYSLRDWILTNTPMVDAPDHSAPAQLSRSRVKGLPYTVSETNEPYPNDYAAEFIPILTAYALLQDWDGLFFYSYRGDPAERWNENVTPSFFTMANDPVKMMGTAIGALMFLRGDVQAARRMVERHVTHERVLESLRADLPDDTFPYELHHVPGRLALTHATALADFSAAALSPAPGELTLPQGEIVSDTGELVWEERPGDGRMRIDAPRWQAAIGRAGRYATSNMAVVIETPFAAVQLASLDPEPIAQAQRLLLVAAARVANTDMHWQDDSRTSLGDQWGHGPTRIELVTGQITLRGLGEIKGITLSPLDPCGQLIGVGQPLQPTSDGWTISLSGQPATLWYLLTVTR